MTMEEIANEIDAQWESKSVKVDWLGLEEVQRGILECHTIDDSQKVFLFAQSIGAFTRRGTPTIYSPA